MYKSRIILGAFASASILATAVAGPALASTSRAVAVNGPASGAGTTQAGTPGGSSSLSGALAGLSGLPLVGTLAGLAGGTAGLNNTTPGQAVNAAVGGVSNASPQLGAVSGDLSQASIPGLSAAQSLQRAAKGGNPYAITAGLGSASGNLGTLAGDLNAVPGVAPVTSSLGAVAPLG